jgi:hypothetical protein
MAMSKGQHKAKGHSSGPYGHGGAHVNSHVTDAATSHAADHMTYKGPGTENVHNHPKAPMGSFPVGVG